MADDEAGPLIGWSLGTGLRGRPLDELVDFPCTYTFKAVGVATGAFVRDVLDKVASVIGRAVTDDEHRERRSARGRYLSITLKLPMDGPEQLYSVYRALQSDSRVKYIL